MGETGAIPRRDRGRRLSPDEAHGASENGVSTLPMMEVDDDIQELVEENDEQVRDTKDLSAIMDRFEEAVGR